MAPNPAVEVKNGSDAYVSAVGGVDVTPGETVILRLSSQVDVDSWSCLVATTDDTSDADAINGAIVLDSTLRTVTFTAPAPGKAYRFHSKVNGGVDRNGVAQESYETFFCVYTRINGRRVVAADETTETDTEFGWTKWLNDLKRSIPSGVASGTWDSMAGGGGGGGVGGALGVNHQFLYYNGGSAVGATGMRYNPTTMVVTIDRPVLGGTTVFTGLDIVADGLADHKPVSVVRRIVLTSATPVPVFAWKPTDEAITSVFVEANAVASGGDGAGSYARAAAIKVDAGVGTCSDVELTRNQEFTHSGVGFTGLSIGTGIWIGVSGATGFVNVKGTATGQIKMGVTVTLQTTSWG